MKKILLVSILSISFLISCAESKAVVDSGKLMRGDWTITNVTIDGIQSSYVNITAFDQAKTDCFIGSTWHLVQNNSSGNYSINAAGCPNETTPIKWFLTEKNGQMEFFFKKIYSGEKPKNVVDGYKMRVTTNTGNYLILTQDLQFEGKPISVHYTFSRN